MCARHTACASPTRASSCGAQATYASRGPQTPGVPCTTKAGAHGNAAQEGARVSRRLNSAAAAPQLTYTRAVLGCTAAFYCPPFLLLHACCSAQTAPRQHWRFATMIRLLTGVLRVRARCQAAHSRSRKRQTLPHTLQLLACLTPSRSIWTTAWRAALVSTGAAHSSQVRSPRSAGRLAPAA